MVLVTTVPCTESSEPLDVSLDSEIVLNTEENFDLFLQSNTQKSFVHKNELLPMTYSSATDHLNRKTQFPQRFDVTENSYFYKQYVVNRSRQIKKPQRLYKQAFLKPLEVLVVNEHRVWI